MKDTHVGLPEVLRHRTVTHASSAMGVEYDDPRISEVPGAAGGAWSTALDMAIFCQMFFNLGAYGGVRILSPASVSAMTRNQIPGISATFLGHFFPEASSGLGWSVHGRKRGDCGGLFSDQAFEHGGAGGVYSWGDPIHEVVGVYLSAALVPEADSSSGFFDDLFTDAVTAAVVNI